MLTRLSSLLLPLLLPASVGAKAILGVDLGSLYMKVALVQRNSPLEIVTNLHSKRKTEVMVLFDNGSRFYGADASSLLARKPHQTPTSLGVMLGRDHEHPSVKVISERHFPLTPLFNETRSGVCLSVNGAEFTPEELVAMVLTHAKEITAAYGTGAAVVRDVVLTVPSFYTQHERRALLDAAELADLNVLALIDETTASALNFGMDRIDKEPKNVLFYNMGASATQASVITYYSYEHKEKYGKAKTVGAFAVKGKGWDLTVGGMAFDAKLVDFMADEFNEQWNKKRGDGETKDVRKYPRPMTKLRLQANKAKHVLSANTDIPIYMDSLYDDTSYKTHISRATFDEVSHDLLSKATKPIEQALQAANMTLDDIDMVELIGGGMRVPRLQEELKHFLGEKLDLGMHINSDESMALGAAFHGANVSTAFKVRHIGMTDLNPFPVKVSLTDLPTEEKTGIFGLGKKKVETDDSEEPWSKEATIFKSFGKVGVKKTIAFTKDQDVHCSIDYDDSELLPEGTEKSIGAYKITGVSKFAAEMAEKGLSKPKVSLQFELSTSGITDIVKAEAVVEEIVIVKEEIEVEEEEEAGKELEENATEEKIEDTTPTEAETSADESSEEKKEGEAVEKPKEEKVEVPKKKKTKIVEKEKKKVHRRTLNVEVYYVGKIKPYSEAIMAESKAKLQDLADKDRERIMLEEARNKVESYIYHIKNKLADNEEDMAKITTEEQRTSIINMATVAEDWLYEDGYDAGLATFEDKYVELSEPAESIFFRFSEMTKRPEALAALNTKLSKVQDLMTKWETEKPQITKEERAGVMEKVEAARKWIADMQDLQENTSPYEKPAFSSEDAPLQTKEIERMVSKLSKRPKPKPVVEEKKEKTNDTKSEDDAEFSAEPEAPPAEETKAAEEESVEEDGSEL